jgi:L-galactose dehydrogenase/L-glyceraldehyde 3-phosphate reductase
VGGILIHQDEATRRAALERALAAGIDWIDTAPSYGDGRSETVLGELLEGFASPARISTKVRLAPGDLRDVRGAIERSLEASLARLRRDDVVLLQLHNPIVTAPREGAVEVADVLGTGAIADALEATREQGLTQLVGITALGDAGAIREVLGSGRFDSAQVYYNILNPSAGQPVPPGWSTQDFSGVLDACRASGVAAMGIRALAAGVLATDVRHGREVQVTAGADLAAEERRAHAVFEALGEEFGTRAQTAIRYALSNDDLACVVFGLATLGHLDEALEAARMGPLPAATLARIRTLQDGDFAAPRQA